MVTTVNGFLPKELKTITIISAHINTAQQFAFVGQCFVNEDAWDHVVTYIIFYNTQKKEDSHWKVHQLKYMTDANGVQGTLCFSPKKQWLFGYVNTAYMLTFDETGEQTGTEKIPKLPYKDTVLNASFSNMSEIQGHIFAVRGGRTAWKRALKNHWEYFNNGIPQLDYFNDDSPDSERWSEHGFETISGFAVDDIYAGGGDGDLWHYNGKKWQQKELPTKASLKKICCANDGLVYIITGQKTVLIGRDKHWRIVTQDLSTEVFENIVWYRDRCYINTASQLYEIHRENFQEASIANKGLDHAPSVIDAREETFIVASSWQGEISYYDGQSWHKIIHRERPAHDPNKPALQAFMDQLQREHKDKDT